MSKLDELIQKHKLLQNVVCGVCIGGGWIPLVDELVSFIEFHVQYNKVPPVTVTQVKEKFGGLRFYFDGGDDYIQGAASFAESMSTTICEYCGKPGKPNNEGWIITLCDRCRKKNAQAELEKNLENE